MVDVRYELSGADVEALWAAFQGTWYGEDRTRADVRGMLAGTDELVALFDDGEPEDAGDGATQESDAAEQDSEGSEGEPTLVAFAHALTDYTHVAFVRDVVVRADRRGEGLGVRLITALIEHPELTDVDEVTLACPTELVPFYEETGFEVREDGEILRRPHDEGDD